jgi:hypothetical protein
VAALGPAEEKSVDGVGRRPVKLSLAGAWGLKAGVAVARADWYGSSSASGGACTARLMLSDSSSAMEADEGMKMLA